MFKRIFTCTFFAFSETEATHRAVFREHPPKTRTNSRARLRCVTNSHPPIRYSPFVVKRKLRAFTFRGGSGENESGYVPPGARRRSAAAPIFTIPINKSGEVAVTDLREDRTNSDGDARRSFSKGRPVSEGRISKNIDAAF